MPVQHVEMHSHAYHLANVRRHAHIGAIVDHLHGNRDAWETARVELEQFPDIWALFQLEYDTEAAAIVADDLLHEVRRHEHLLTIRAVLLQVLHGRRQGRATTDSE